MNQQRSALNGKTEPIEEYTSKLNNKYIDILYESHAQRDFFCLILFPYFYNMISPQDFQKLKYDTLKYFWGYTDFRDSQEEIINAVINEKIPWFCYLQEQESLYAINYQPY